MLFCVCVRVCVQMRFSVHTALVLTPVTMEGYRAILFVLTLIAGSRQQKPCNPTAITTRLIDSTGTERERQRDQEIDKEREVKR